MGILISECWNRERFHYDILPHEYQTWTLPSYCAQADERHMDMHWGTFQLYLVIISKYSSCIMTLILLCEITLGPAGFCRILPEKF